MDQRPLLVVNPASGGGKTGKTFDSMLGTIRASLGEVDVVRTNARGHAIELAKAGAKEGRPLVVAVGGDGTFHEVVNGVMDAGATARVGLIAQGTGGDFRKSLGLDHRLDHYLAALKRGRTRKIDVGKLRYRAHDGTTKERWFVNILSAGMGGLADQYVAELPDFVSGKAAYFAASARALLACKEGYLHCRTALAGKEEYKKLRTYVVAICNGAYFGGGMHVAPMAKIDDGKFEIVSMGAATKLAFAINSSKIYTGEHLKMPHVEHWSADAIDLELENQDAKDVFLLDVDGEPLGGLPLQVELHKGAIELQA